MSACYRKSFYGITNNSAVDVPCPGTQNEAGYSPCCYHGDTCLSNGICHFTHSSTGGSGYYMQDCTDETYNDSSVCPQACTDQHLPDVVYDYSAQLWFCCGTDTNGKVTCADPTAESFSAPPPNQLQAANSTSSATSASQSPSSSPASSTATSSQTSASISSASSVATTSNNASSSSALSSGAAAGIGVGVGVLIIILTAGVFVFWRKRRHSSSKQMSTGALPRDDDDKHLHNAVTTTKRTTDYKGSMANSAVEMPGPGIVPHQRMEMPVQNTRIELE